MFPNNPTNRLAHWIIYFLLLNTGLIIPLVVVTLILRYIGQTSDLQSKHGDSGDGPGEWGNSGSQKVGS